MLPEHSGSQQRGMHLGTLNVLEIIDSGKSCRLRQIEMVEDERAINAKRDRLQAQLIENIPELIVNGDKISQSKSGWRDSNPRPFRPERNALPSCATSR